MITDPKVKEEMKAIAQMLQRAMPQGYGFALLCFPFGSTEGNISYISSGKREDMIAAMKILIANFEARVIETPAGDPN